MLLWLLFEFGLQNTESSKAYVDPNVMIWIYTRDEVMYWSGYCLLDHVE